MRRCFSLPTTLRSPAPGLSLAVVDSRPAGQLPESHQPVFRSLERMSLDVHSSTCPCTQLGSGFMEKVTSPVLLWVERCKPEVLEMLLQGITPGQEWRMTRTQAGARKAGQAGGPSRASLQLCLNTLPFTAPQPWAVPSHLCLERGVACAVPHSACCPND